MSGICGFLDWDRALDKNGGACTKLDPMLETARHLGPDGVATHCDESVAIAQFLDWQTPEAAGVTSVTSGIGQQVVLVADVRIDNRRELNEQLKLSASETLNWTDEQFLLASYECWGLEFPRHILGDFFVAIWDRRLGRLLLVRDALGTRPALYYRTPSGLVFGSEVNVIAAHRDFRRRNCRTRIADFLGLALEDNELTFYEGLVRLPPGSMLVVTRESTIKNQYWKLELTPELRLSDYREYSEIFRSLLIDSVHCRVRANGPVGFLLSGGLDSSSIVGIARDSHLLDAHGPLRTFSALFSDYPLIDERCWIDEITSTGCFAAEFVRVDRRSPIEHLAKEIREHGEPFFAPNNYVDSALLDLARQAGVRIVIDGLDGDTTVGHGWEYLGELLRRGKWRRLARIARALDSHTDKSAWWFIWRHAVAPTLVGLVARFRGSRAVRVPALMRDSFAKEVQWVDRVWGWRKNRGYDLLSDFRSQHWGKLRSGLVGMCFEIASHQAGARGIVRRHPYFDRRLVEFCVSLPASQRLDRGVDRLVQRRAVEGFTPENIRTRLTKSIWVQNFADRMALTESQAIASMCEKDTPAAEFVEMDAFRAGCRRVLDRSASERTLAEIWVVMALDIWLSRRWCE